MIKIWVLNRKDRLKTYQSQRFNEEAAKLGVKIKHVCPEYFEIVEPGNPKNKIWCKGKWVTPPDIIITRLTGMSYLSYALLRTMERMGVTVVNKATAIELAEDKLRTIQRLAAYKLPIPQSILAKYPVDIDFVSNELGFPLIMKTVLGAKGDGVLLFDDYKQMKSVVTVLQQTSQGKANLIFQHYVKHSFGRDLRVFVVGDTAIAAAERQGAPDSFKANVSAGGTASFYKLDDEVSALAVQATKALGLDIAGVDFLFDENQLLVGEVNSSPCFEGFETTAQVNVPEKILAYALQRHSKAA